MNSTSDLAHLSDERKALIERARQGWIKRLIDRSRRNRLLFFKPSKTSSLDINQSLPSAKQQFFSRHSVSIEELFSEEDLQKVFTKIKEIRRRATANYEERGLETLFLATGLASWPSEDGGTPIAAPIILIPVRIDQRGRDARSTYLSIEGEAQLNLVLSKVMEDDFGVVLHDEDIFEDNEEDEIDVNSICNNFVRMVDGKIAGLTVSDLAVLGTFVFQKMAMVNDLLISLDTLTGNEIIAAVAGDTDAQKNLGARVSEVEPREFDSTHPKDEAFILDADSSQQTAIASILSGNNGIIQGPPGTGKSQTISNVISTMVAAGKRVLFVSEKRAALQVVFQRLKNSGLGHLALDLHGTESKQHKIVEQIAHSLDSIRTTVNIDHSEQFERLYALRARLNKHANEVNLPRSPSGLSVFALEGNILRSSKESRIETRWKGEQLQKLTSEEAKSIKDLLKEASGFEHEFLRDSPSPWNGANFPTGKSAEMALEEATRINKTILPKCLVAIQDMLSKTGFRAPVDIAELQQQCNTLNEAATILSIYRRAFFALDHEELKRRLLPIRSTLQAAWAYLRNPDFRAARQAIRSTQQNKSFIGREILHHLDQATNCKKHWSTFVEPKAMPTKYEGLPGLSNGIVTLNQALTAFRRFFPRKEIIKLSLGDLESWFTALASDRIVPFRLVRLHQIEQQLREKGLESVIAEMRSNLIAAQHWQKCFEFSWWSSCLEDLFSNNPELAGFNGDAHREFVTEFFNLDADRLKINVKMIKNLHARGCIDTMNSYPQQASFVRREAARRRRHKPLRRMIQEVPNVLLSLFPCWMASPLSISQVISSEKQLFDLVIFDEASQVLPEDAISAIIRAKQVVVAGDSKQLPPTTFFASIDDDDEQEEDVGMTAGVESILDTLSTFMPSWWLEWHYRSRTESLIAFSNRHIYGDRLITFPNSMQDTAVKHEVVDSPILTDIETESSAAEVQRVVELVVQHAESRPGETLGVITLGIKHTMRIEAALDRTLALRRDLDVFFDQQTGERFFVKNLERVQGDERDAIILSVGYGKDRGGKLVYRFGPLLHEGGERRLNVAITRARKRLTVVSSFAHTEMDPAKCRARGMWLLRAYLQYAAHGGSDLSETGQATIPLNSFEWDVSETLKQRGVNVVPQYGVSRYRIDLAITHPKEEGRFVLAVECDGASYHSSPTAMERDRLRQTHLEALGWNFHRIWSTDWFYRKEAEVQRFMQAYIRACDSNPRRQSVATDRGSKGGELLARSPLPSERPADRGRASRPSFQMGLPINAYSRKQMNEMVLWILSDGQLRTDAEIVDEIVREMGFSRRGKNIVESIQKSISSLRTKGIL